METASTPDIGMSPRKHRLVRAASLIGRPLIAAISLLGDVGKIAAPVMTTGYIAAMGQPSPTTGFVLAVVIELGRGLLRVLGPRTRITAVALPMFSIARGLRFHLAIGDLNALIDRRTHTGNTPETPNDPYCGSKVKGRRWPAPSAVSSTQCAYDADPHRLSLCEHCHVSRTNANFQGDAS